ncbi:hypothetical protein PLICRDRAFT_485990, partial [Plicaturopsis crispa FD-325 SS-3]
RGYRPPRPRSPHHYGDSASVSSAGAVVPGRHCPCTIIYLSFILFLPCTCRHKSALRQGARALTTSLQQALQYMRGLLVDNGGTIDCETPQLPAARRFALLIYTGTRPSLVVTETV